MAVLTVANFSGASFVLFLTEELNRIRIMQVCGGEASDADGTVEKGRVSRGPAGDVSPFIIVTTIVRYCRRPP